MPRLREASTRAILHRLIGSSAAVFPKPVRRVPTCAVFGDASPHHYDEYTFTNTTGATQCVTVDTNTACTGTNFIFIAAYLDSFDPDNICTNWIGDSGSSPNPDQPFQFNVDDGQTFVVVVSEVTPEAGCPSYTVTVTPEAICGGGTPRRHRRLRQQRRRADASLREASTRAILHRLIDSSAAVFPKPARRVRHVRSLVMRLRGITMNTRSPIRPARLNA